MKEIKTIIEKVESADDTSIKRFDERVNKALQEGFTLKKREFHEEIITASNNYIYARLYAELEREV